MERVEASRSSSPSTVTGTLSPSGVTELKSSLRISSTIFLLGGDLGFDLFGLEREEAFTLMLE